MEKINGRKQIWLLQKHKMTHAEIVDYTVAPVFMIDRKKEHEMDD
jgi:hypothetical protein